MRIYGILSICFMCCSLYAMEQEISSAKTQLDDVFIHQHPELCNRFIQAIANELFDRDMTVQRADLVGFPVYMRNDLWARIKALKNLFGDNIAIKNSIGPAKRLRFELCSAMLSRGIALFGENCTEAREATSGQVNIIPTPPSSHCKDSCCRVILRISQLQGKVRSDPFFVDGLRGCYINLARRNLAKIVRGTGKISPENCSYGIERRVVLRNTMARTVHVRVKDMTTASYIFEADVKPLGLISCVAFMPLTQLAHIDNCALGIRIWDSTSLDPNLNKTGATTGVTIIDLMPLKGFATYFDISGLMRHQNGSYAVVKFRR